MPMQHIFSNDVEECNIDDLINVSRDLNINVDYKWINDLNLDFKERTFDLTFIDTWHIYGQLKIELAKFSKVTKKYIILHDTTVDAIKGETIRLKMYSKKQSLEVVILSKKSNADYKKPLMSFYLLIQNGESKKSLKIIMVSLFQREFSNN